ncbi:MAG: right-handed parallel beta-helix repeat-containing protein [Taibaiella sp.]|nr:right-handed parallel beta-helix repeat-containing protein [Taibaiella sp.]
MTFRNSLPVLFFMLLNLLYPDHSTAQHQKTIRVTTLKEFCDAIGDNTRIIIDTDELDITADRVERLKFNKNPYILTNDNAIGFTIQKVSNLMISSESEAALYTTDETDRVLVFENCDHIVLERINLSHRIPVTVSCFGEVLSVERTGQVLLRDCSLNGSGTIALDASESKDIRIESSRIFNNSSSFTYCSNTENVTFSNCLFYENALESAGFFIFSSTVHVENCTFRDNVIGGGLLVPVCNDFTSRISFSQCTFKNVEEVYGHWIEQVISNGGYTFTRSDFEPFCTDDQNGDATTADTAWAAAYGDTDARDTAAPADVDFKVTKEEWISRQMGEEIRKMRQAGVSKGEMDRYCDQVYRYKTNATGVEPEGINVDDPVEYRRALCLEHLYRLEDQKREPDLVELDEIFDFPLYTYWDKLNFSKTDLASEYQNNWGKLIVSTNLIRGFRKLSSNFYEIDLDYIFVTKKSKKFQNVHSRIRVQFEKDKIKSISPVDN